jgi:hypothetical protein
MQSIAGQNYVSCKVALRIDTKGETILGFSAPSKHFDVYIVTKLYQESMAGYAYRIIIK